MSPKMRTERRSIQQEQEPCVRKGPYRGDVSALCLVSAPRRRLLLAGTGPQLLLYDLVTGGLLCSQHVFDGVRVHGLYSGPAFPKGDRNWATSTVVIHGERRVKLFKMANSLEEDAPQLQVLSCLPRFSYWVLDVRLLHQKQGTASKNSLAGSAEDVQLLAIGLSNNTIRIWDLLNSAFIYSVECSEKCLLYSMRLWGDSLETLRAGAGTVFNEVLVWKPGSKVSAVRDASAFLTKLGENGSSTEHQRGENIGQDAVVENSSESVLLEEVVDPLQRDASASLTKLGHNGSSTEHQRGETTGQDAVVVDHSSQFGLLEEAVDPLQRDASAILTKLGHNGSSTEHQTGEYIGQDAVVVDHSSQFGLLQEVADPLQRDASAIVTKLGQNGSSAEYQRGENIGLETAVDNSSQFVLLEEVVDPIQRVAGHEGSIHRLTWSSDGSALVSVSDDRTARVWRPTREKRGNDDDDPWLAGVEAGPVLYGHASRLWDCYVGDKLLITASEDCTCRVWTAEGKCLATLKGHIGRGIWRCVYDPELNILITGGADSSIKVQSLEKWVPRESTFKTDQDINVPHQRQDSQCNLQSFSITPLWSNATGKGTTGFMDSKSEYVRCLALSSPWSLYVCTNLGAVYHVNFRRSKQASWKLLINDLEGPIVCMDVLRQGVVREGLSGRGDPPNDDMVVVGNGKGRVSVIRVRRTAEQWHCVWHGTWAAEKERQLLGVYFCNSMGAGYVFTTDPRGRWLMWHLSDRHVLDMSGNGEKDAPDCEEDAGDLVAYGSGSQARILCVDVCPDRQLLVCGDKQGSLAVFSFPKDMLQRSASGENAATILPMEAAIQLPVVSVFKGAHGISAVASVSVLPLQHGQQQAEITSTGSDGCICRFLINQPSSAPILSTSPHLVCTGIEKVAALSVVECLEYCKGAAGSQKEAEIAAGFTGSHFLLWDLTHRCEVMRVPCGGWRRPHSVFVGDLPQQQYCFVFVKDQVLQVQRNWLTSTDKDFSSSSFSNSVLNMSMQSLRGQFHGKEIPSVSFARTASASRALEVSNPSSWIATGSEDGTVIISRYVEETGELEPTSVLGDHVGGSSVRALAVVSEVHLVNTPTAKLLLHSDAALAERKELLSGDSVGHSGEQELLFSAGSKEVLTCWRLNWLPETEVEEASLALSGSSLRKSSTSLLQEAVLPKHRAPSAQWLSTHSAQRAHPPATKTAAEEKRAVSDSEVDKQETPHADQETDQAQRKEDTPSVSWTNDDADDDQRYLALTAFATRCAKTGTLISFVATASSNATLHLYAFHVNHRSWIELAVLEYPTALVLTIEHFVAPFSSYCQGACDVYMIVTGAAHGNIALWDVTNPVLKYSSSGGHGINKALLVPLRPLTGRGSQGGRLKKKMGRKATASPKSKQGEGKERDEAKAADPLGKVSSPQMEREYSDNILSCHAGDTGRSSYGEENGISNKVRPSPVLEENGCFMSSRVQPSKEPAASRPSLVLHPLHELIAAHQSGVNCMSVARIQGVEDLASNKTVYLVISGGDDQALHTATLALQVDHIKEGRKDLGNAPGLTVGGDAAHVQCLSQSSVPCAHSSAVKGVWTDGVWAFSTGLDQRLRCWRVNVDAVDYAVQPHSCEVEEDSSSHKRPASLLVECMTCVIDVPEAASLHVKGCLGGRYQIVVVGRGLQVINFDSNSSSC